MIIDGAYQFEAGATFEYERFDETVEATIGHIRIFANEEETATWVEWTSRYNCLGIEKTFSNVHPAGELAGHLKKAGARQTHYPRVGILAEGDNDE